VFRSQNNGYAALKISNDLFEVIHEVNAQLQSCVNFRFDSCRLPDQITVIKDSKVYGWASVQETSLQNLFNITASNNKSYLSDCFEKESYGAGR
jgi:hypothetical protein